MLTSTIQVSNSSKQARPLIWALGLGVLIGTWMVLYWAESLFTESHLVGYYCCVSEGDLPATGTLARTISDFFRIFPGKHLLSLLFVLINATIFVRSALKLRGIAWLPFLFVFFNLFYLPLDTWLVGISWSISDRMEGPLTGAYKGYHRTWYGIALHFLLWAVFFFALARAGAIVAKKPDGDESRT